MIIKKIKRAIDTYIAKIKPDYIYSYYLKDKMDHLGQTTKNQAECIQKWREAFQEFQIVLLFVHGIFAPEGNEEFPIDNSEYKNLLALARQEIALEGYIKKSPDGKHAGILFTNSHEAFYQETLVQKHINLHLLSRHIDGIYNLERDPCDINIEELNASVTMLTEEFFKLRSLLDMLNRELTIFMLQHNHHHEFVLNTFYDCFIFFESSLIDGGAPLFINTAEYFRGKQVLCKIADNINLSAELRKKNLVKFFEELIIYQYFIFRCFNKFFDDSVTEPHKGFIVDEITELLKITDIDNGSVNHYGDPDFKPVLRATSSELEETAAAKQATHKINLEIFRQEKVIQKFLNVDEFYGKIDQIINEKNTDVQDHLIGGLHWQLKFNMDCLLYIKNSYAQGLPIYEASEISIRVDQFFKPKPEALLLQHMPLTRNTESRFIQTQDAKTGKPVLTSKNPAAMTADSKPVGIAAEISTAPAAKTEATPVNTRKKPNKHKEMTVAPSASSSALLHKEEFDGAYKSLMRKIPEFNNLYGDVTTHPLFNTANPDPKKDRMKDSVKVTLAQQKYHAAITQKLDALKAKMDTLVISASTPETTLTTAKDYLNQINSMHAIANNLYREIDAIYKSFIKTQINTRNKAFKSSHQTACASPSNSISVSSAAPEPEPVPAAAEENIFPEIEPEQPLVTPTPETAKHTLTITVPPEQEDTLIEILPANPAKLSFIKFPPLTSKPQSSVDPRKRNVEFDKMAGRYSVSFSEDVTVIPPAVYSDKRPLNLYVLFSNTLTIIPPPVYPEDGREAKPLSPQTLQKRDAASLSEFNRGKMTDPEKQFSSPATEWCQTIGCFFKKSRHAFVPDKNGTAAKILCPQARPVVKIF